MWVSWLSHSGAGCGGIGAWLRGEPSGWLMLLFVVGNLIFPNTFANLTPLGFWGLPLGMGVSGSLTLIVGFVLFRRQALYLVKPGGTA